MFPKASTKIISGANRGDTIWAAENNVDLQAWQPKA